MADLRCQVSTGEIASAAGGKTFLTLTAPANQRLKIKSVEVFGKGTSNTDAPAKVELIVTTTSITGGSDAATNAITKVDNDMGETPQATVHGPYTAEPTYSGNTTIRTLQCHPQSFLPYILPEGDEIKIKGGQIFSIRISQASGDTFSVVVVYEE